MVSSTTPDVSLLLSGEFQRYQNSAAVQIATPFALTKVLDKACAGKGDQETYMQFFNNKLGITEEELRIKYGVFKSGNVQLQKDTDASDFDPTLLNSLIKATSDKLNITTQERDVLRTELNVIIQTRNAFSHSNDKRGNDPSIFQKLKKSLPRIIRASGTIYKQDSESTKQEIKDLEYLFRFMQRSERADVIKVNIKYFCDNGMKHIIEHWKNFRSLQFIPFINKEIKKNVHFSLKIIRETNKTEENESMLLRHIDTCGVTILREEAGAGKSTIVRSLCRKYLRLRDSSEETARKLSNFDMIHFMDIRDVTSPELTEYFRNNFPTVYSTLGSQNILDCFVNMTNLAVIDGYDEINDISAKLLRNFLKTLKSSTMLYHCIITTRPHASNDLHKLLNDNGMKFNSYFIADITNKDDQLAFLKKYEKSDLQIENLTFIFDQLPRCVTNYFTSVVLLTWFVVQCLQNKKQVQTWTRVSDVTNDIFTYYTQLIERKLTADGIKNRTLLLKEFLEVVTLNCLQYLARNKISITEKEKQELAGKCLPVVEKYSEPKQVDISHVLSSLYVTRTLLDESIVYEFYHKSHMEIFAAKALFNRLKMKRFFFFSESAETALKQLAGESSSLDKYVNQSQLQKLKSQIIKYE